MWLKRYRESSNVAMREPVELLVGFNANIDVVYNVDQLELDLEEVEPKEFIKATSEEDFKSALKNCIDHNMNQEIDMDGFEIDYDGGKENIGGQAGIMSNFLSGITNSVIFYTPFLAQELADQLNENILYPVIDGKFVLKNVRDSANTDRIKKNYIFQYENEKSGRFILSSSMKGFGPYFRKGVENNFDEIDDNIDRVLVSGFHDVEGNTLAKIKKSANQLRELESTKHLEYVHKNDETSALVVKYIFPEVDSLGLDGDELKRLADLLDLEVELEDEVSLGHAFHALRLLMDRFSFDRIHIHTWNFHLAVTDKDYEVGPETVRESMLFGQLSAVKTAELGRLPATEDFIDVSTEKKHLAPLTDLEHFENHLELEDFAENGIAEVEGYNVVAIPTLIEEEPKRLVGLGDVISSAAFSSEIR